MDSFTHQRIVPAPHLDRRQWLFSTTSHAYAPFFKGGIEGGFVVPSSFPKELAPGLNWGGTEGGFVLLPLLGFVLGVLSLLGV